MIEDSLPDDEVSLFTRVNTVLQNRRQIAQWAGVGAILATLSVVNSPAMYKASASFVPQGGDAGRSGLAGLAGQLGVTLSTSNQALTPDFYVSLLRSRELLGSVAHDTFTVRELGSKRIALLDLLKVKEGSLAHREELGVRLLTDLTTAIADRKTGVVRLEVKTRWPSVSLGIATNLVVGVNGYNQRTRQTQAMAERKFLQRRLESANSDLREAENRQERFLTNNKQLNLSPQLKFENDRLARNLVLQQQVVTSLTQAYEDAKIREVRDTPVITMLESPTVRTEPEPRGRTRRIAFGFLLGAIAGIVAVFVRAMAVNIRKRGDVDGEAFLETLEEIKRNTLKPFWRRKA